MLKGNPETNGLRTYGALFLLMLVNAFVVSMVIDDGHDWRGDFAMYVSQAQALLNGTVSQLYEMNRYAMDTSSQTLGPYLYQFGFPVLLSTVLAVFGLNFYAMKALCAAGLVLSIPLIYKLSRVHFNSSSYPILIAFSIAFHASYVVFADSVLSDLPFLFCCLITLNLMTQRPTWINQLILGLLIYFTYAVRDIGIVLIPTLLVLQFQSIRSATPGPVSWYLRLIPYAIFITLFVAAITILPVGQENHLEALFLENSWASILDNVGYYQVLFSRFFYISELPSAFFWFIFGLMAIGLFPVAKRSPHLVAFVGFSMFILILWPYKQGMRFLFPLLPMLLLFLSKGLELILDSFAFGKKAKPVIFVIATGALAYLNIGEIRKYAEKDTNLCYTQEMKEVYQFVASEIPKDKIVAHYYPRVFRMFTGVNSVRQTQYEFDLRQDIDYFQGNKHATDPNVIAKYQVVFESENEIILAKRH